MASRREEMRLDVTAEDRASKIVKGVADEVDKLDGRTAEVDVTAQDRATAEVRQLMSRIDALTDDEKKVALTAESKKLQAEVDKAIRLLGKVDETKAEAVLEAKDLAQAKLAAVQGELDEIAGRTATATVDADEGAGLTAAEGELDAIDGGTYKATVDAGTGPGLASAHGDLREIDGGTYKATVDADAGSGLTGILSDIDGLPASLRNAGDTLGKMSGAGGAVALFTAALGGAAAKAADVALEADEIAKFTGASTEDASALAAVLRDNTQIEMGDLLDIVAQMTGVLGDNPEILRRLGINAANAKNPLDLLVQVVDALNTSQLSANDKILIGSQLFGEEGVRQINSLTSAIDGSLSDAIAGVAENRIVHADDVERARELKQQWTELSTQVQGLVVSLGQGVIPLLQQAVGVANVLFNEGGPEAYSEGILEITDAVAEWMRTLDDSTATLEAAGAAAAEAGIPFQTLVDEMARIGTADPQAALESLASATDAATEAVGKGAAAFGEAATATDTATDAFDEQTGALETLRDALDANIDALTDYIDAQHSSYDANIRHREATEDTADAIANYATVSADAEATDEERRDAGQRVVETIRSEADAYVAMTQQAAASRGETLSNTQAIENWNHSLANSAATIAEELIPQVVDMAMQINDIPASKRAEVEAAIRTGDPAIIEATLNNLSRTRKAGIQADVDTAAKNNAEAALNNLARDRYSKVITTIVKGGSGFGGRAAGDPFTSAGTFMVGEQGPELVQLPAGSRVLNAAQTRARTSRFGSVASALQPTANDLLEREVAELREALEEASRVQAQATKATEKLTAGELAAGRDAASDARAAARYEVGDLTPASYLSYLRRELGESAKYSDEWMETWRQIQQVSGDIAAAQEKEKQAAEERAQAAEERRQAAAERLRAEFERKKEQFERKEEQQDRRFQVASMRNEIGEWSDAKYLAYLQKLLGSEAKFSDDWIAIWRAIKEVKDKIAGKATGDPFTSAGMFVVGEQGPELVTLPAGSQISTAGQTAEMLRNGGGGGTVTNHITNNWPRGMPSRDVAALLRRQQRVQARPY